VPTRERCYRSAQNNLRNRKGQPNAADEPGAQYQNLPQNLS